VNPPPPLPVLQPAAIHVQLVTPGIRPGGVASQDQARVVTPAQALRDGSTWLVVGRPITRAEDPAAAADAILAEMGEA